MYIKPAEKARRIVETEYEFQKRVLQENGHSTHEPLNLLVDFAGFQRAYDNMPIRNAAS